jgi:hypothetical protein
LDSGERYEKGAGTAAEFFQESEEKGKENGRGRPSLVDIFPYIYFLSCFC